MLVVLDNNVFSPGVAFIDENNILLSVEALKNESAFVKFFDGAIFLYSQDGKTSPKIGERVIIKQMIPFDIAKREPLPNTITKNII